MKNLIAMKMFGRGYDDLPLASEIYIDLWIRKTMCAVGAILFTVAASIVVANMVP